MNERGQSYQLKYKLLAPLVFVLVQQVRLMCVSLSDLLLLDQSLIRIWWNKNAFIYGTLVLCVKIFYIFYTCFIFFSHQCGGEWQRDVTSEERWGRRCNVAFSTNVIAIWIFSPLWSFHHFLWLAPWADSRWWGEQQAEWNSKSHCLFSYS